MKIEPIPLYYGPHYSEDDNKKIAIDIEYQDKKYTIEYKGKKYTVNDLEVLEKYKAIEQELGIDLITFHKALKEGIYIKTKNEIKFDDCFIPNCETGGIWYSPYDEEITIYFKDYGKTWALTREELENDN